MGSRAPRLIKPFLQHRPFKFRLLSGFLPLSHICSRSYLVFAKNIEKQKDKLALFTHTHAHVLTHTHSSTTFSSWKIFSGLRTSFSWLIKLECQVLSDPKPKRHGEEQPSTKIRLFWVWESTLCLTTVGNRERLCAILFYVFLPLMLIGASLVAQTVKHLPAMQETWVWFLDWDDPLEKKMATHSSILA